jgi:hypothetical protein
MFAHVENGEITFRGTLPKNWRNISGLDKSKDDVSFLKSIGWLPLTETQASLGKNDIVDGEDKVIEENKVTVTEKKRAMTSDEITARDAGALSGLRNRRDKLLKETDHFALVDKTLTDAMKKYRQDLRQLPQTTDDLTNIVWPTEPA